MRLWKLCGLVKEVNFISSHEQLDHESGNWLCWERLNHQEIGIQSPICHGSIPMIEKDLTNINSWKLTSLIPNDLLQHQFLFLFLLVVWLPITQFPFTFCQFIILVIYILFFQFLPFTLMFFKFLHPLIPCHLSLMLFKFLAI